MNDLSMPIGMLETYKRMPVEFVSGSGAELFDDSGKTYIDVLAGIGVAAIGHSHSHVVDAIATQVHRLLHVSNLYYTRPALELAERLHALFGMQAFFCNSGAEAIECAFKLVRRAKGPGRVIAADGGFHGRTFGALSLTGQPSKQDPFAPLVPGVVHVPFGDTDAIEANFVQGDVVAIFLEPIQGENGVVVPPNGYFKAVEELCRANDALLVVDEVQTGYGRTGTFFAHEHDGVTPDIVCIAKAMAGGLPMGACLARPSVAAGFELGDHGSTFGGGPVQSAAALAVLDVIEKEGLAERALAIGERLKKKLGTAFPDAVEIRGRGAMIGIQLPSNQAGDVVELALERGVVLNNTSADVLRLLPPLVITDEQIDRATVTLGEVWASITSEI
jgi:acetylornithine/N-succinyldiaminopimelate aminotransferase